MLLYQKNGADAQGMQASHFSSSTNGQDSKLTLSSDQMISWEAGKRATPNCVLNESNEGGKGGVRKQWLDRRRE